MRANWGLDLTLLYFHLVSCILIAKNKIYRLSCGLDRARPWLAWYGACSWLVQRLDTQNLSFIDEDTDSSFKCNVVARH